MFAPQPTTCALAPFWAAFAIALLTLLGPSTAAAHDFDPERQLLVQVFEDHVDIMVMYTEAPGERSDFFSAQFGFQLGGELGQALEELAGRAILPRMLDGLEFEIQGETPRTGEPEVRVRTEEGRVMAAAYVRYELHALADDAQRTVIVRAEDKSFIPTRTVVYGGGELVPREPTTTDEDHPVVEFELYRGSEEMILFGR